MTNLRLITSLIEDMHFCPFCGDKLEGDTTYKHCGFHIGIWKAEEDEEDWVE